MWGLGSLGTYLIAQKLSLIFLSVLPQTLENFQEARVFTREARLSFGEP